LRARPRRAGGYRPDLINDEGDEMTTETETDQLTRGPRFIDVDVHERAELADLLPYLDPLWHRYITDYGWEPERLLPYAQPTAGGLDRADSKPDGVRPGGSDLGFLREQLLDSYDVAAAVLTGWLNVSSLQEGWPEFKNALMSAYNDWQVEQWLERDQRLHGSIHVNTWDVEAAVGEIERMAEHPRIAQVMLYSGSEPFGAPRFHPIFAAAARHHLPVAIHHSENSPTALGRHRYFVEWHTLVSQVFMSQAVSIVFNGVLDRFENLKVILVEGGFSYVPHLMWRADQQYRELRHEVPWLKRMPSEAMRAQLRFATQPIEEFTAPQLSGLIDQMGSEELLCFSTDYPHWDFDSPLRALPAALPKELADRIFLENALDLYPRIAAAVTEGVA
jgi:predicted TIM-barrel fold metal-dependent hydrolase